MVYSKFFWLGQASHNKDHLANITPWTPADYKLFARFPTLLKLYIGYPA